MSTTHKAPSCGWHHEQFSSFLLMTINVGPNGCSNTDTNLYGIRAKQQRNPRKNFRNHPDQNRRRGPHHGKTTPPDSDAADLSNGPAPAAVRATFRLETNSRVASVRRVDPRAAARVVAYPTVSPFRSSAAARVAHRRRTATFKTVKSVQQYKSWASHRHPPVMDSHMFMVSRLIKPIGELFLKLVHPCTDQSIDVFQELVLVCEHCKKQRHTKDRCWKLHSRPPRGNKCSSKEQQNLRRTDVREIASTSQPIGPTTSQTSSPTLSTIA
ncbi:UBN2_3 domain-containing protein [Cucumis melo var. makuwa]|uniref:UBN2_3 domain-containing protein n=1 Tax=Cucumis melo var. makuwa TaxID=1194695 RepID=A0A5D3BQX0_CUCMM|nr:UBN2_3 domain-containing protein [Cucumis melo var. makuwa]TYK01777.1 UBN2_3 domain-containing protein [Cucumis melo var. makuwa]